MAVYRVRQFKSPHRCSVTAAVVLRDSIALAAVPLQALWIATEASSDRRSSLILPTRADAETALAADCILTAASRRRDMSPRASRPLAYACTTVAAAAVTRTARRATIPRTAACTLMVAATRAAAAAASPPPRATSSPRGPAAAPG